jgi:hypothetical protein
MFASYLNKKNEVGRCQIIAGRRILNFHATSQFLVVIMQEAKSMASIQSCQIESRVLTKEYYIVILHDEYSLGY